MRPLRLVVYDATDTGPIRVGRGTHGTDGTARGFGGLTRWWRLGAGLHHGLIRRADATLAARSWSEALLWAASQSRAFGAPIGELQAWGHGGWGYMGLGETRLDRATLAGSDALAAPLAQFRAALAPSALVWLRCCSVFGGEAGATFAPALASALGVRVAGHTYVIGALQSGTHSLAPGERVAWPAEEGTELRADGVRVARGSAPGEPRTLTCLRPGLPDGW